ARSNRGSTRRGDPEKLNPSRELADWRRDQWHAVPASVHRGGGNEEFQVDSIRWGSRSVGRRFVLCRFGAGGGSHEWPSVGRGSADCQVHNVWVANSTGRSVTELCGARPENCPPGKKTGDPISPPGGYIGGPWETDTMVNSSSGRGPEKTVIIVSSQGPRLRLASSLGCEEDPGL